jgi:cytochrome c553
MKKRNTVTVAALLTVLAGALPATLQAKGNAEAGKEKAQVCSACHDPSGNTIDPSYPILAGQYEDYLVKALADYRAGRRSNPIMGPMAANLTDQDIEDLAAFYASLKGLHDLSIQ